MAGKADSLKTILYALCANFALAVAKFVAAFLTQSGAMLAEAIHSLADCGNQVLLLVGMKRAKKPPSPDYPLGYGKAIYFWSFLVALILFSVGGMFSVWEGWHKLSHPTPLSYPWIAVGVLAFGIIVEAISMAACVREVNKARGSDSLWTWFRTSRQSELVVIFGEDLAALLGLVFALVAVVLTMITGNPLFDAIGTLGIGALLIVVAIFIAVEVKGMLIGESVDPRTKMAIHEFLAQRPEVETVLNLITLQLGSDVMIASKLRMHRTSDGARMLSDLNSVEAALKKQFPEIRWSFCEPDLVD